MPATSKSQQRLMAMAYQVKQYQETGAREGVNPLDIEPEYRREVEDLAASMPMDKLKDFAETSHKDLPERKLKESGLTGFLSAGPFPRFNSYAQGVSNGDVMANRDRRDPLIQTFLDFIDGKKRKKEDPDKLTEVVAAMAPPGVAAPQNTPGMGNVTPPSAGNVGSGDKFGEEEDEEKEKVGLLSYDDYKKWIKKWQKQNRQKQERM